MSKTAMGRRPLERRAAELWLEEQLLDGPVKASEVLRRARRDRMPVKTVRRAADVLGVTRTVGRGSVWTWPRRKRAKASATGGERKP
jgi:hypothetical protein